MKQIKFLAFAVLLVFAANFSAMALSLEAQAVIEEMRERLLQRESIASPVDKTIASGEYVPGRDLRMAIARARSAIHRGQYQEIARASAKPQSSSEITNDTIPDSYRPGSLLGAAMERVRYVRSQYWPDVRMGYEDDDGQSVVMAVQELPSPSVLSSEPARSPLPKDRPPAIKAIASAAGPTSSNARTTISRTPEFVEVDTTQRLEQRRQQLLRSKNLPDLSSPSEAAIMQASAQSQGSDAEQESKEFNRFISRYEYKMPSNYRIIVR